MHLLAEFVRMKGGSLACCLFFLLAASLAALSCARAAPAANANLGAIWRTDETHRFRLGLRDGLGFSFSYDGQGVGPEVPAGWQVIPQLGGKLVLRHPSGLTVTREAHVLPDGVEYTVLFRNEGAAELPALSDVQAVDLSFIGQERSTTLVSCGGGGADSAFPPKDFAVKQTPLGPDGVAQVTLSSARGLPSAVNIPFFFLQGPDAGLYLGIGWTGEWQATVSARPGEGLRVQGGMPGMRIRLRPGEEISGPHILLGAYHGPLASGTNALRGAIRDGYAPKVAGQRLMAPIFYTTWFDIGAELDEKMARVLVDRCAEIGQEIFLVDAGWYKGTPYAPYGDMNTTWRAISNSLGNWEQGEERSRFPAGLAVLADYARAKGMQFGLWFELERVGPDSLLAREHPDWVIHIPNRRWGLANLGRPEVQEYFIGILDRCVRELGLRYIRWDANIEVPATYWAKLDEPERQGLTQIRYLEGLHRIEESVVQKHPEMILESCTGGGQRIDLETLRRRHTIWISDSSADPAITRFHLEGLNQFVPGSAQAVHFGPRAATARAAGFVFPDTAFQVSFGGAFGSAGRLQEWPQPLREQARRHYDVFRRLRRFLSEDFYLLEPQARSADVWSGWQFHDPKAQEGFVQAFRNRSPEQTRKMPLYGLDARRRYRFTDPYTGAAFEADGKSLTLDGLEFDLGSGASRVLMYQPVR